MRYLISRLIRALKIRWWSWRNPPPTLESLDKAREKRLALLDLQHSMEISAFDVALSPVLGQFSLPAGTFANYVPTQREVAISRSHAVTEPYMDHVSEGYRQFSNGDRIPIPR